MHCTGIAAFVVVVEAVEHTVVDDGVEGVGVAVEAGGVAHREFHVHASVLGPVFGGEHSGRGDVQRRHRMSMLG